MKIFLTGALMILHYAAESSKRGFGLTTSGLIMPFPAQYQGMSIHDTNETVFLL